MVVEQAGAVGDPSGDQQVLRFVKNGAATLFSACRLWVTLDRSTMQRNPSADRTPLIITSGIVSAVLAVLLFCLAYLVL